LAWHCSGTYNKVEKTGGSDGARMRFNPEAGWGANAGLDIPRNALESVKVCAMIMLFVYCDLWVSLLLFTSTSYIH